MAASRGDLPAAGRGQVRFSSHRHTSANSARALRFTAKPASSLQRTQSIIFPGIPGLAH